MAGVFGGDSSVVWEVVSDNPRVLTGAPDQGPGTDGKFRQGGKENTDAGKYFVVSIEVPRTQADKNDLALGLFAAADRLSGMPAGAGRVWFRLKIEDESNGGPNENQIKIDWPSSGSNNNPGPDSGGSIGPGETIPGTTFGTAT